jgi:hypothetical protein
MSMRGVCPLCEGFQTIHPHAARPISAGTPIFCWVPSRCTYAGGDRTCPACSGEFRFVGDDEMPCFGDCGEHPEVSP